MPLSGCKMTLDDGILILSVLAGVVAWLALVAAALLILESRGEDERGDE